MDTETHETNWLRLEALKLACARNKDFGYDATPQDITAVAEIFYQFLKGETK
jgi:hypothetical protein